MIRLPVTKKELALVESRVEAACGVAPEAVSAQMESLRQRQACGLIRTGPIFWVSLETWTWLTTFTMVTLRKFSVANSILTNVFFIADVAVNLAYVFHQTPATSMVCQTFNVVCLSWMCYKGVVVLRRLPASQTPKLPS